MFNRYCYFCHGYSGDARTVAAGYLEPPPRDFTAPPFLNRDRIMQAVMEGRPGTAMHGFNTILKVDEITAVANFVEQAFGRCPKDNQNYHTAENGWPDHQARYGAAYSVVLGQAPLDAAPETLGPTQQRGLALYRESCIVCHDVPTAVGFANESAEPVVGEVHQVSDTGGSHDNDHDRAHFSSSAYSGYPAYQSGGSETHDRAPVLVDPTAMEALGETLYARDCALCHAADGSGRNWIGRFLEPHPPDLRDPDTRARVGDRAALGGVIRNGLTGTSMPAFRSVLTDREIEAIVAYVAKAFLDATRDDK